MQCETIVGACAFDIGEFEKALVHMRRAFRRVPHSAPHANNLGAAAHMAGARELASRALFRALQIAPTYPEAARNLENLALENTRARCRYERLVLQRTHRECESLFHADEPRQTTS